MHLDVIGHPNGPPNGPPKRVGWRSGAIKVPGQDFFFVESFKEKLKAVYHIPKVKKERAPVMST